MRKIFLFILLVPVFGIAVASLQPYIFLPQKEGTYENLFYRFSVWKYPVKMYVVPEGNTSIYLGVSVEKTELNFGIVPLNSRVVKFINVSNSNEREIWVRVVCKGNVTRFLKFEREFKLKPGDVKTLQIEANAIKLGNFTGEINVISIIPKFW
jgi:hypothetical protein